MYIFFLIFLSGILKAVFCSCILQADQLTEEQIAGKTWLH